ncbi:GNAT family N-acetyltransferase [Streptomyces sp. NPDC008001]|uniref:GNAT family N-acetyltransferase n=1 Tax=Streptomyces sp. NPDC008001 TaxID=3364804 RepID=UPI0036EE8CDA
MEITDDFGLPVAMIGPDELSSAPWRRSGAARAAVVRMPAPPPELYGALARRGFVRKPSTVTWRAALGASEEEFLARLPRKTRQHVHRARRLIAREGLREAVEDRITPESLDRFLALYEDRVSRMPYGVAFARRHRENILYGPEKYAGVFLYRGDALEGGALVLECPEEGAVRVRWSAVTEAARRASLPRQLYCTTMRVAREKGYAWATLGDDPNLYGHIARPGLFTFKARMGFEAVPSQDFADPAGFDEADLVLSLEALTDPVLMLGYADDGPGRALRSHVVSASGTGLDAGPYTAAFLSGAPAVRPPGEPGGAAGPAAGGTG